MCVCVYVYVYLERRLYPKGTWECGRAADGAVGVLMVFCCWLWLVVVSKLLFYTNAANLTAGKQLPCIWQITPLRHSVKAMVGFQPQGNLHLSGFKHIAAENKLHIRMYIYIYI